MSGSFVMARDSGYQIYARDILNPNVVSDQPVVSGAGAGFIGILVDNPAGVSLTVQKATILSGTAQIKEISDLGGSVRVRLASRHWLNVGDSVTIVDSNSTPSVDGVAVVTAVGISTFDFVGGPITVAGNHGRVQMPEREFVSAAASVTTSAELVADHAGGLYRIKITGPAGPYAQPVTIFTKRL